MDIKLVSIKINIKRNLTTVEAKQGSVKLIRETFTWIGRCQLAVVT